MVVSLKNIALGAVSLAVAVPLHATSVLPEITPPAIQAPRLTDPQLASVTGGRFGFRSNAPLIAEESGTQYLMVQASIGREMMDNWWAYEGNLLIAANLLR